MTIYQDSKRIVGTNADRVGTPAISGGWKELGRISGSRTINSSLTVSSLADKRYYMILGESQGGATYTNDIRLNADSGSNYAIRQSVNGGTSSPYGNQNQMNFDGTGSDTDKFGVGYISNLTNKAKLYQSNVVQRNTAGHGTAPDGGTFVGKWYPSTSSDVINSISMLNRGSGTSSDGELVVLGYDPDDTHTDNFWEQLDSFNGTNATTMTGNAFTPKKYLWIQGYLKPTSGTITPLLKLGSGGTVDTTGNYSLKYAFNGASPVPMTNTTAGLGFFYTTGGANNGIFFNTFIINKSGQDKLCISEINDGASQPDHTRLVSKWVPTTESDQANIVGVDQWSGSGTFSTDSIIKVWGSN